MFYLSDLLQGLSLSDLHFGGIKNQVGSLGRSWVIYKVHLFVINVGANTSDIDDWGREIESMAASCQHQQRCGNSQSAMRKSQQNNHVFTKKK